MRSVLVAVLVALPLVGSGAEESKAQGGAAANRVARGTFEVKVTPLAADEKVAGLTVGRFAIEKKLLGDIQGSSKGEMMTADTVVEGSAGYVAIERVAGKLAGRSGSFTLLHQGTMRNGANFELSIKVVPDSGAGELTGLAGAMRVIIEGGTHSYELDYTLPDAR